MFFPFLYLAGSLSAGIFLASVLAAPLAVPTFALLIFLTAAWLTYFRRKNSLAHVLALPAAFFLGWILYVEQDAAYERNPVRQFVEDGYADFSGRLFRSPSYGVGRTSLSLRVENIGFLGRDIKARGNLRVSVLHPSAYPSPLRLRTGDRLTVSAHILPGRECQNFGESRLAGLRKSRLVHNSALTKSSLLVELKQPAARASPGRLISGLRQALQNGIERHFSNHGH